LTVVEGGTIIGPVDIHAMAEVSGCPTSCMHCWALGRSYRPMPIEDAAFFLDEQKHPRDASPAA
jgi:hypothetical protein